MTGKSLYRNGGRVLAADTAIVDAELTAAKEARRAAGMARKEAEDAKPTVMVPRNAKAVRVRHLSWFRVTSVNDKTVSVVVAANEATGAQVTARYPLVDVVAVSL